MILYKVPLYYMEQLIQIAKIQLVIKWFHYNISL